MGIGQDLDFLYSKSIGQVMKRRAISYIPILALFFLLYKFKVIGGIWAMILVFPVFMICELIYVKITPFYKFDENLKRIFISLLGISIFFLSTYIDSGKYIEYGFLLFAGVVVYMLFTRQNRYFQSVKALRKITKEHPELVNMPMSENEERNIKYYLIYIIITVIMIALLVYLKII